MKKYCLIILKPDAIEQELVEEIMFRLVSNDFKIEMVGINYVSESLIFEHYEEVIKKLGNKFEDMARKSFVNKYMMPMVISHTDNDAIKKARRLIGETDPSKALKGTIRGDLGTDSMILANQENRCVNNLIHCSDSEEAFIKEVTLWFSEKTRSDFIKETRC